MRLPLPRALPRLPLALAAFAALAAFGAGPAAAHRSGDAPNRANDAPQRLLVRLAAPALPPDATASQIHEARRLPPSAAVLEALGHRAGTSLAHVRALGDGWHVLVASDRTAAPSGARMLKALHGADGVERVEDDLLLRIQFEPSDTDWAKLWNLKPPVAGAYGADFQSAWGLSRGAPATRIAVLDTGVLPHPDLAGPGGTLSPPTGAFASEGYDFISDCRIRATCPATTPSRDAAVAPTPGALDRGDWISGSDRSTAWFADCTRRNSSWHGTHVAGIVAALGDNGQGVIGGAFESRIVPVRVLGKCGGFASDVAEGIRWAAGVHPTLPNPAPARVINLSLAAPSATCPATLQSAIDTAVAAGAIVVTAAGNDNGDAAASTPSNCRGVIVVAAASAAGDRAYYSNTGASVTLSAPGGDTRNGAAYGILSALNRGTTTHDPAGWSYVAMQGTSSAAPHVAAAVGLMLTRNPALAPAQVRALLAAPAGTTPFPPNAACATSGGCGAGILDARLAVTHAVAPLAASLEAIDFGAVAPGTTASRELEVRNVSGAPVSLGRPSVSGTAGFAAVADDCAMRVLDAGASCRIGVSFTASVTGIATGTLAVPMRDRTDGSILAVPLSAAVGARLAGEPSSIVLPDLAPGGSSSTSVRFVNRYPLAQRVDAVVLSNDAFAALSRDGCTNVELAPGAACEVALVVTPTVAGPFALDIRATTAPQDVPATITVTGTVVEGGAVTESSLKSDLPSVASGGGGGCTTLGAESASPDATLALIALALVGWKRLRRWRMHARRD
jgi:serine protease